MVSATILGGLVIVESILFRLRLDNLSVPYTWLGDGCRLASALVHLDVQHLIIHPSASPLPRLDFLKLHSLRCTAIYDFGALDDTGCFQCLGESVTGFGLVDLGIDLHPETS